jgi:hypothetical protein
MLSFYRSATYKKLKKEETKYWKLGAVALYQEYLTEKQTEVMQKVCCYNWLKMNCSNVILRNWNKHDESHLPGIQ